MTTNTTNPARPVTEGARVTDWLGDIGLLGSQRQSLVLSLRGKVLALGPDITEEVKYGGLLFSAPAPFCGVFSYTGHVSLEFGRGADLRDPAGLLEGAGKLRRHLKLQTLDDLLARRVDFYLDQAHRAAKAR